MFSRIQSLFIGVIYGAVGHAESKTILLLLPQLSLFFLSHFTFLATSPLFQIVLRSGTSGPWSVHHQARRDGVDHGGDLLVELNFLCSVQCFTEKSVATEDSAPGDKELVELDPLAGGGVHGDGDVCGALGILTFLQLLYI